MDTKLATTNIRIQQWLAVFKARNESGLKIDEYCVDRHSKPNQYDIEYPVIEPYYLEPLLPGRIIEVTLFDTPIVNLVKTISAEWA